MKIYKNSVSDLLWEVLSRLMSFEELDSFRLVGGTSLSLQLGHRKSVDIDMFTDAEYNSIDFDAINNLMLNAFDYVEIGHGGNNSMGNSYYVGKNKDELVKVDMFYADTFVYPIVDYNGIRLARLEEVSAMKLEVVGNKGRKKDFWDLHELLDYFSLSQMLDFYNKRYPYSATTEEIITNLTDFSEADSDFDPICLKGKYWELIKIDFEELVKKDFR